MNILFNTMFKYAGAGGVTTFCDMVLRYINKDEFQIRDLLNHRCFDYPLKSTIYTPLVRRLHLFKSLVRFNRILSSQAIDLVHLNPSLKPYALARDSLFALKCQKNETPFVTFFHGCSESYQDHLMRSGRVDRLKEAFGASRKIFVLTRQFSQRLVEWGFEKERIVHATTMVDDHLLTQVASLRNQHIKNQDREKPVTITFLGRIIKEKGVFEALAAYHRLHEKGHAVRMVIAGDGPAMGQVKQYIQTHSLVGVTCTGFVSGEQKATVLSNADLFLFPTYTEGMPIAVLEAMAAGVPVITRPVGGVVDFFQQGIMGLLVNSLNPEDFAEALETLITNPEMRSSIAAFNATYAAQHFRASVVVRKLQEIYRESV
ncbi:MAG: glycosyltransferase family 4 protein [Chitinivibrionales bacterium]|nr:glycosyltransferase family 4 protein [Chitinivibrionales bacterium]